MRDCRVLAAETRRAEGDPARALAILEPEMAVLEAGAGAADTVRMAPRTAPELILSYAGDARAEQQLALAWQELQLSVPHVRNPAVKARILTGGPVQREMSAAWTARGGRAPTARAAGSSG